MTTPIPGTPSRPLQYIRTIANSALPTNTRTVCWGIASLANETTGKACPSLKTLSKATGLSTSVISRHTNLAESLGYLHKRRRFNNSVVYVITTPIWVDPGFGAAAQNNDVEMREEVWNRSVEGLGEPSDEP